MKGDFGTGPKLAAALWDVLEVILGQTEGNPEGRWHQLVGFSEVVFTLTSGFLSPREALDLQGKVTFLRIQAHRERIQSV